MGERLSLLSSCICERTSRVSCFGVENDQELAGERDANDHFGLSGLDEALMKGCQMRIVPCGEARDQEEDGSRSGAAAAYGTPAGSLAAVIGDRREAGELGDGLVGDRADFGQLGHQAWRRCGRRRP